MHPLVFYKPIIGKIQKKQARYNLPANTNLRMKQEEKITLWGNIEKLFELFILNG
jgi:hypothetical protein